MAQLYDCFEKGGLTSLEEIYRRLATLTPFTGREEILSLAEILNGQSQMRYQGRVFAKDMIAPCDSPAFANAAVDGYAFARKDIEMVADGGNILKIAAYIEAGSTEKISLQTGEAAMIFTGAQMPDSADTVLMHEDAPQDIDAVTELFQKGAPAFVTIAPTIKQYDNYRPAGDDVACGQKIIAKGDALNPASLALCVSLGILEIPLLPRLSIALFSTGDELCSILEKTGPAQPLQPGQIYDANRPMLSALFVKQGIAVEDYGIVKDDLDAITDALDEAAAYHDVIVTSGAMSQGRKDYIRHLLEKKGRLNFLQAAVKPGRPVGIGEWRGTPIIGLPGNPVASFTTALIIALPMLHRLQGRVICAPVTFPAIADFHFKKRAARKEYVRVTQKSQNEKSGLPLLSLYGKRGAGVISSLVGADGFAVLDESRITIEPGMQVDYLPFHQF